MATKGKWRGHNMTLTDVWRYDDTGAPVEADPDRACGHCNKGNTPEGHDGCLGTLKGAMNACCGHGVPKEAYVQLSPSLILEGGEAVMFIRHQKGEV